MRLAIRLAAILPLGTAGGCTSFIIQQQAKHPPSHYGDCPRVYAATRMELSSLSWAFSDDLTPSDACLNHYYKKAAKDPFFRDFNKLMIPGYLLSLPADVVVDTITLPFANW
jgi:uncharacterized protein YceK